MPSSNYKPPVRECAAQGCPRTARVSRQLCSKHARLHAKRKAIPLKEGRCLGHIPREMKLELKSQAGSAGFSTPIATGSCSTPSSPSASHEIVTRRSPREHQQVSYKFDDEDDYTSSSESESEAEREIALETYSIQLGKKLTASNTPTPSCIPSPCSSPVPSSPPMSHGLHTSPCVEVPAKRKYKKREEKLKNKKLNALAEAVLEAVITDFDLQTFEANVQARRNSLSNPSNVWGSLPALQQVPSPLACLEMPSSPKSPLPMAPLPPRFANLPLPTMSLPPISSIVPMMFPGSASHITLCNPTAASTTSINLPNVERVAAM